MHNQQVSSGQSATRRPVGTPFQEGKSGNEAGRPLGIPNLESRVRALLDGDNLPAPIALAIRNQCGEDRKAIDAVIIGGLLQALQGSLADLCRPLCIAG